MDTELLLCHFGGHQSLSCAILFAGTHTRNPPAPAAKGRQTKGRPIPARGWAFTDTGFVDHLITGLSQGFREFRRLCPAADTDPIISPPFHELRLD
ncbi:unnamed protein product [Boreogadus saida]